MKTTFKGISTLILFMSLFVCFQNCDYSLDNGDVRFEDCVGKLDVDVFHFKGTHHPKSIEYYENTHDYIQSFGNSVSIAFNSNMTFTINVKLKCDTLSSVPACDSLNFSTGFRELNIEGSWDFEQQIETYGYRSWQTNRMIGQCNLNVIESTNDVLNGEKIVCDTHIDCSISTIGYVMNIDLPVNVDDRLRIQIFNERQK